MASANLFGDPCPGTRKYLEAHYKCESAIQTTTAPSRISPPSWQLTSQPSVWSTSTIRTPTTSRTSGVGIPGRDSLPYDENFFNPYRATTQRYNLPSTIDTRQQQDVRVNKPTQATYKVTVPSTTTSASFLPPDTVAGGINNNHNNHNNAGVEDADFNKNNGATPNDSSKPGMNDAFDHDSVADERTRVTTSTSIISDDTRSTSINSKVGEGLGVKSYDGPVSENQFCGPTVVRNLFWNITQAGDINVQPCPGE